MGHPDEPELIARALDRDLAALYDFYAEWMMRTSKSESFDGKRYRLSIWMEYGSGHGIRISRASIKWG